MSERVKPPAIAAAILNFFSSQRDFAAIAGDLQEEFLLRLQRSGGRAATVWYWREILRNSLILTVREVWETPFRTLFTSIAGMVAVAAVIGVYLTTRYSFKFWSGDVMMLMRPGDRELFLLVELLAPLAIGWIAARLLPRREWALAVTFTVISVPPSVLVGLAPSLAWCYVIWAHIVIPKPLLEFMVLNLVVRLAGFTLGCLVVRRSRLLNPRTSATIPNA
jgi:hypothetical protein